jgi:hypothetical protein
MIDIFEDIKPDPKLYIADIVISASYKVRNKLEKVKVRIQQTPIVLANGKLPTKLIEERFFRGVYDNHIKKGKFENTTMKIESIENIRFSSNLAYVFNYDKH